MPLAVYQDVQLSSVAMTSKNRQAMKTSFQLSYDHAKQYDNECSIHVYDDDGSCMAIYLRMAMEMP